MNNNNNNNNSGGNIKKQIISNKNGCGMTKPQMPLSARKLPFVSSYIVCFVFSRVFLYVREQSGVKIIQSLQTIFHAIEDVSHDKDIHLSRL